MDDTRLIYSNVDPESELRTGYDRVFWANGKVEDIRHVDEVDRNNGPAMRFLAAGIEARNGVFRCIRMVGLHEYLYSPTQVKMVVLARTAHVLEIPQDTEHYNELFRAQAAHLEANDDQPWVD